MTQPTTRIPNSTILLDAARGRSTPQPSTAPTRFTLEPVPPFRLDLTAWALRRRPANIVDRWDGAAYRRAVKLDDTIVEVEVLQSGRPEAARLDVSVTTGKPIDRARRAGRDHDDARPRCSASTSTSASSTGEPGTTRTSDPSPSDTEGSSRPASRRCSSASPTPSHASNSHSPSGSRSSTASPNPTVRPSPACPVATGHAFPEPADLAAGTPADLRRLGLSTHKAEYLLELAHRVADGEFDLAALNAVDNNSVSASLQTAPRRRPLVGRVRSAARPGSARRVPGRRRRCPQQPGTPAGPGVAVGLRGRQTGRGALGTVRRSRLLPPAPRAHRRRRVAR